MQPAISFRERILWVTLALGLWVYLILRAIYVPLINDEAVSFFTYIRPGEFLPFLHYSDANNHLLNSALAWLSVNLFGENAFALRLPNLLAFAVFSWYAFRFVRSLSSPLLRVALVLAWFGSHYFLEFFSLGRGYGMSLALLLAGLWHLWRFYQENRPSAWSLCLLFMSLALAANLALLTTVLAVHGLLLLLLLRSHPSKVDFIKYLGRWAIVGLIPVVFLSGWALSMQADGHFYYGTDAGLFQGTMQSLVLGFLGQYAHGLAIAFSVIGALVAVGSSLLAMRTRVWHVQHFLGLLLLLNILGVWLLHLIFGVNYPLDRAVVHWWILFTGAGIFMLQQFEKPAWTKVLALSPLLLLGWQFASWVNVSHHSFWADERLPDSFYQYIVAAGGDESPTVSARFPQANVWDFQNLKEEGILGRLPRLDHPNEKADWLMGDPKYFPDAVSKYTPVIIDGLSGNSLWQRKQKLERTLLETQSSTEEISSSDEFVKLWRGPAQADKGTDQLLELQWEAIAPEGLHKVNLVVVAYAPDWPTEVARYTLGLEREAGVNGEPLSLHHLVMATDLPAETKVLEVYLWNKSQKPLVLKQYTLHRYVLTDPSR